MILLIRVDANNQIGTGHVMRCMALAQAWRQKRGQAVVVTTGGMPALETRLRSESVEVVNLAAKPGGKEDASETANLARQRGAWYGVLDGYHFGGHYQQILKESGLRLLCIDDGAYADHYYADIILNQNLHADESLYKNREPYVRALLGTRYALLRQEFLRWQGYKRHISDVGRKVLVTLGGADPCNLTAQIVQALQDVRVPGLEVTAAVGMCNTHVDRLRRNFRSAKVPVCIAANVLNMSELMAWADVAIVAGGSTCWEAAFMGLPVAIVVLAENQRAVANSLAAAGVAMNLDWFRELPADRIGEVVTGLLRDPEKRMLMSLLGRELVDGLGCDRVLQVLEEDLFSLRKVTADDLHLLWVWANDAETRAASFASKPIPMEEHSSWLHRKLLDSRCYHYIVLNLQKIPVGQIRFDVTEHTAEISVSLAPEFRGRGCGPIAIRLAFMELFRAAPWVDRVLAHTKVDNQRSSRAFIKAGFTLVGLGNVKGETVQSFLLNKADARIQIEMPG